jgi:O-acetylserine/cysteine efflux transporter
MTRQRRIALTALAAAGLLWGLTVPLSKLALEWLDGSWLAAARFGIAAPLLALVARRGLRPALTCPVIAWGALGYGLVIVLQNAGIARTSVSHAALIVGAVPALVALIALGLGRAGVGRRAWLGFALALAGVGLVAGQGGSGATAGGDALVLASAVLSAAFIIAQPRLLAGRDATAVTAVQMAAGALTALPFAVALGGKPAFPSAAAPAVAVAGLALAGTLLPMALFAHGQTRVAPELAGAFVNLEPLVGAGIGALAFHDAFGSLQLSGGLAVLVGIALSALPRHAGTARRTATGAVRTSRRRPAPAAADRRAGTLRSTTSTHRRRSTRDDEFAAGLQRPRLSGRSPAHRGAAAAHPLRGAFAVARTGHRRHAYRVPVVRELPPGPPSAAGASDW